MAPPLVDECDRTQRKSALDVAKERDATQKSKKGGSEAADTSDSVTLAAWFLLSIGKDSLFFSSRPPKKLARFAPSGMQPRLLLQRAVSFADRRPA